MNFVTQILRNRRGPWNKLIRNFRGNKAWDSSVNEFVIACEQALLFGRAKQAARERASEQQTLFPAPRFRVSSRVPLARPLFTISPNGEFTRRLSLSGYFSREKSNLRRSHSSEILSHKIHTTMPPAFVSQKIEHDLKMREANPPLVKQQRLVYKFECSDLCDASYVGYTCCQLAQKRKFIHRPALSRWTFFSTYWKNNVSILKKYKSKFDRPGVWNVFY